MTNYAGITVHGRDGRLQLLVEVKNKWGMPTTWAAKMRRNIYAHGELPHVPFFMLALPDVFCLWKERSGNMVEPTYQIDPRSFLNSYYEKAIVAPGRISGERLELIVSAWLHQVTQTDAPKFLDEDSRGWLVESGLFDAIRGGRAAAGTTQTLPIAQRIG
jgi:hypothetical protein